MAISDVGWPLVNPVVDDRTPFSALPSPYGPWEEKERRKKEKEIGGEKGEEGGREGRREGESDREREGDRDRERNKEAREIGGSRDRVGERKRQALRWLMAVPCG